MEAWKNSLAAASRFLHHHFLWCLVGAYVLASYAPYLGLWIRNRKFEFSPWSGWGISIPSLMLSLLLFNAGLGIQIDRLRELIRRPSILIGGHVASLAVPLLFILGASLTLRFWHNHAEVQSILVGLALVASMPVAGSSTAWSQNANGDMVLSLGLVVLSTFLSPVTTPAVLHVAGWVASGEYADSLKALASNQTSFFLMAFVFLPSLFGIIVRCLLPENFLRAAKPLLKLTNMVDVLVLCYSNAAVALPQTVSNPDWDFLFCILLVVSAMCVLGFGTGWLVARVFSADEARQSSLVFGLGMTNNGTGLVLAASALSHLPSTVLPIIFYNLVQHIVAACADRLQRRAAHAAC